MVFNHWDQDLGEMTFMRLFFGQYLNRGEKTFSFKNLNLKWGGFYVHSYSVVGDSVLSHLSLAAYQIRGPRRALSKKLVTEFNTAKSTNAAAKTHVLAAAIHRCLTASGTKTSASIVAAKDMAGTIH